MTYFNTNTFSIGSSPFITIYPLIALYLNYSELPPECQRAVTVSPAVLAIFLPIVFGVVLSVVYQLMRNLSDTKIPAYTCVIASGAASALIASILLEYLRVYDEYLLVSNARGVHVFAVVFYAVVFASIGKWLFRL